MQLLIGVIIVSLGSIGVFCHRIISHAENAFEQSTNLIGLMFFLVVLMGSITSDLPLSKKSKKILGSTEYDMQGLVAPRMDGVLLRLVSKLVGHGWIGHLVRRPLININGPDEMRDLANQAGQQHYPIIFYPICRTAENVTDEMAKTATDAIQNGLTISYDQEKRVGIMDYYRAYKTDKVTPSQMMFRVFEAMDKLKILNMFGDNIFVEFDRTKVMEQARESDIRWEAKKPLSVFDGVPVAVKDTIKVRGFAKRDGMPKLENDQPSEKDDLIVQRLREAGAIILATTVMTEFGRCPLGYNSHYKGPFNPYDETRYSGGSSSGSVVAVMTGLVPMAVSFDSGGSIRLPAGFSGAFGLAPTFARIPHDGDDSIASPNIHAGVNTATATDHALAYALLAQNEPGHFYSRMFGKDDLPRPHLTDFDKIEDLSGLRIGVFWDYFNDAEPEIIEKCKTALQQCENRGAKIVNVAIPHLSAISLAHQMSVSMEISNIQERDFYCRRDLEPATMIQLALGNNMSSMELLASSRLRGWAMDYCKKLFEEDIDVLATPTVPITAPPIPETALSHGECNMPLMAVVMKYAPLVNFTGMPGMSIPIGYSDKDGLPISLQLMADYWNDALLLRLSHFMERKILKRKEPKHYVKVSLEA